MTKSLKSRVHLLLVTLVVGRFLCSLAATCDCGWKKQTGITESPSLAELVNADSGKVVCSGTIISSKHVLTAARCVSSIAVDQLHVWVGYDNSTGTANSSTASVHTVSSYTAFPLYDANTGANDIAIITISDTIVFTVDVGPACLPFKLALDTFVGTNVTALGWGTLESAGATLKVQLDVTPITTCQSIISLVFNILTTGQFCTNTSGTDACKLGSGGPLLWQNPASMRLVLLGIVSYAQVCADTTSGVNTRVGPYTDWITSVTPDAGYCIVE